LEKWPKIMRENSRRFFSIVVLSVVILGVGLGGGVLLDRQVLLADAPSANTPSLNFNLIDEAWNIIQKNYVDRTAIQPTPLTYGAISGMTDALGDTGHSTFLTPQMVKQEQNYIQGQFEGIGAEVQMKDGHVVIVAPIDNSPAQKAGLQPGDIILKVNGEDVTGLSLNAVVQKVLGPAGTTVTLTIQDPTSGQTREVSITRARIEVNNIAWHMLPGTTIAHVRLAGFSQGVTQDLEKALNSIKDQGASGLILDLRNNPGGLLDEAVGVASEFLTTGDVLLEKDAQGNIRPIQVEQGGVATEIPMVVLINSGTASASEIVAGALQDQQRAKLVGETTFGTGTVLNQFKLSDGSALMLATEEWLTPDGRVIWHKGISPDVEVTLPANATQLVPEAEQSMTPTQLQNSTDDQLLQGLKILTNATNQK
jgi:carboxyl-terminal processing protease